MAPFEPMQSLEMYWWMNKQAKDSTHIAWFPLFISSSLVNEQALVHLISFVLASVSVSTSVLAVYSKSRKRFGGGLKRMELNLGLHFGQNGARSWPTSRLAVVFFFCFWVVGLIMIWWWWGYGLWLVVVVDCGHGGGAELWVLIVVVVEWVATLRGFQIFFFFFLVVGFIWFWLANGGWPPWPSLAPLWATAMTAKLPYKPPSNFRSKHSTTTIGRMNNGVVFLSLVCFYFLFNLWLGSKTFFNYNLGLKNERDFGMDSEDLIGFGCV